MSEKTLQYSGILDISAADTQGTPECPIFSVVLSRRYSEILSTTIDTSGPLRTGKALEIQSP